METTEKKKHKGGYELLKEKLAKAEAKISELQKEKEILVQTAQDNYCRVEKERDELKEKLSLQIAPDFEDFKRVERERDEWKAKYEGKSSPIFRAYEKLSSDLVDTEEKLAFLLDHCPFWVRWKYRKQFEKGGN